MLKGMPPQIQVIHRWQDVIENIKGAPNNSGEEETLMRLTFSVDTTHKLWMCVEQLDPILDGPSNILLTQRLFTNL